MILRDYQQDASDAVMREWEDVRSTLVVLPTGCVSGDTVIGINRASKGYSRSIRRHFELQFDKRIKQNIRTMVRSFLGNRIGLHPSRSFVYSGEKQTVQLELENGKRVRATFDHEVLTESGYIPIGGLTGGDRIVCERLQNPPKNKRKLQYRRVQGLVFHPYAGGVSSYRRRGNHVEGRLYAVPLHRIVAEAAINSMDTCDFIHACRTDRARCSEMRFLDPSVFAVHHRDGNSKNNDIKNLEVMTHRDHASMHGENGSLMNFGYFGFQSSKVKTIGGPRVESVYDVVCEEPHRNFVGNGIVLHNCGKTIVFADIIRRMQPARALVLAHREELIFQAVDKIHRTTGLYSEVEMGTMFASLESGLMQNAQVIVSSIQTQTSGGDGSGRMTRFDPDQFGVLIVDEAHHATAGTYRRCIDYYSSNPKLKILGVTATPDRSDEEALGQMFQTVAFDYEMEQAINDGWLCPIRQHPVEVDGLDYSTVRTTAGDLNGRDLANVLEQDRNIYEMAGAACDLIGDRRTIFFCESVDQAKKTCGILNARKAGMSDWVCGKTSKDDRRAMLARFMDGTLQCVCNCGVLTEGFDNPGVEVIVMGRPTKSRALYAQMLGRATRPLPGIVDGIDAADDRRQAIMNSDKPHCLILDFVGNAGRHKLVTTADILGGKYSEAVVAAVKRRTTGRETDVQEALEQEEERQRQEQRSRLTVNVRYRVSEVSPFDVWRMSPDRDRGWHQDKSLTDKQRNLLLKAGMDPDSMTYAQGRQILNEMFRRWDKNLCTFKQSRLLARHGYDARNMTMAEASKVIDALAANGWRRTVGVKA